MEWFSKKEAYLYGQLQSLMCDQFDAAHKHKEGRLGLFGRKRINPRDERMAKVVSEIIRLRFHKYELEHDAVMRRALTQVSRRAQFALIQWGTPRTVVEFTQMWFCAKGAEYTYPEMENK